MIAQLDREMVRSAPGRSAARLVSYLFFEGRPLTTRGRWWNPVTFANLHLAARFGCRPPQSPIFIIGMGRSGTTLLGRLLAIHPEVGFMNEPKALWHVVVPDEDVIGSYAMPESGRMCLTAADASSAAKRRAQAIFGWFQTLSRSARAVDKYPELIFRRDFVREIFPDAKFLIATRSPAKTLSSVESWSRLHGDGTSNWWGLRDQKWRILWDQIVEARSVNDDLRQLELRSTEDHLTRAAVEWTVTMREAIEAAVEEDARVVSYDDLTASPSEEIASIVEFCELGASSLAAKYAAKTVRPDRDSGEESLSRLPDKLRYIVLQTQERLAAVGG